jgi:hypothetical protein
MAALLVLLVTVTIALFRSVSQAASYSSLHSFSDVPDGAFPQSPPIVGKNGVLYATTALGGMTSSKGAISGGIVYLLTPPSAAGAAWTEAVVHVFEPD